MLRSTLLLAASLLAACALPVAARPRVELSVIDRDQGDWLAPVRHRGQDWIAGTPGHRYSVRLTNTSGERVLVVLSVDGVNAVTGQTAHPSQAGYVLGPWQSTEVNGWRKSLDDVAQFVFTDLPDSYAARTGRPDNVGVIGIAVFAEARPVPLPRPVYPPAPVAGAARKQVPSATAQADAASAEAVAQGIGTGHGEREWSPVSRTDFVRASRHPQQVHEVRYDEHRNLVARGILPQNGHWPPRAPSAFPEGFVADPPFPR
ncbi:hypothetical protein [Lysobacter olei]